MVRYFAIGVGVNNDYLTKTEDPIALLYNNHSVLENASCAALFFTFRTRPETNMLEGLGPQQQGLIRKAIIDCILATDMAAHFRQLEEFNKLSEKLPDLPMRAPLSNEKDEVGSCRFEML